MHNISKSLKAKMAQNILDESQRCPFLREAQVKSCQASAYRKQILRTAIDAESERCLSEDFVHCPAAKLSHEELPTQSRCPFLQESLVQYCSAASVTKFVPYTWSALSRCAGARHHYCELYRDMAHPARETVEESVDGIAVPSRLHFSRNHLWLDRNHDGSCHIGVDALLARILGSIEKITYLTSSGSSRPSAVFTAGGIDFQLMFPNALVVTGTNTYLRANPERLRLDPYGNGWLFEGTEPRSADQTGAPVLDGLLTGNDAKEWMREELSRMSIFVHQSSALPDEAGIVLMNDGGSIADGAMRLLSRDIALRFYTEFFSLHASFRR